MHAEASTQINSACPRCGGAFHCGVNDSVPCACGGVKLNEATLQGLRERFRSCLCLNCLRRLQTDEAAG
ncbi:MAG: cysteine-rich CWC family protein [Burkholderiales bacterium]